MKLVTENSDREWEQRILCSDGACIGVIGADGRCKVCGKAYEGDLPDNLGVPLDPQGAEDPLVVPQRSELADPDLSAAPGEEGDEWSRRTLCRDDGCIGVIGADGRCKVCGKPYAV